MTDRSYFQFIAISLMMEEVIDCSLIVQCIIVKEHNTEGPNHPTEGSSKSGKFG